MGKIKKRYYYDLPQYRDDNNSLLFLTDKIPLDGGGHVYILVDCYNEKKAFRNLHGLYEDFITYKYIIEKSLQFHELMKGKDPRSLPVNLRSQLIHVCIDLGYRSIATDSKPSFQNIADIFGQTRKNAINGELKFKNVYLKDPDKLANTVELMKFITDPISIAV